MIDTPDIPGERVEVKKEIMCRSLHDSFCCEFADFSRGSGVSGGVVDRNEMSGMLMVLVLV